MPDFEARIENLVRGNDLDVIRTISIIPTGQTITDAWFRVDDIPPPAAVQLFMKHVTPTLVSGEGQIEDTGAGDGVAIVRFELTAANTLLMIPAPITNPIETFIEYPYGIQVKTSGGKIYEFERGVIPIIEQIVIAA